MVDERAKDQLDQACRKNHWLCVGGVRALSPSDLLSFQLLCVAEDMTLQLQGGCFKNNITAAT